MSTKTRERSICLKPWEVRAFLTRRKTQLWRPINLGRYFRVSDTPGFDYSFRGTTTGGRKSGTWQDLRVKQVLELCPFGQMGDLLIGKETWAPIPSVKPSGYFSDPKWINRVAWYEADNDRPTWGGRWRSSAVMPRSASRFVWRIGQVRIGLIKDISEQDALATGGWEYGKCPHHKSPCKSLAEVWNHDYPDHPWGVTWAWGLDLENEA